MLISLKLPHFGFNLPFFMLDLDNKQLILSKPIPGDISDNKQAVIAEAQVPGLNFEPVAHGGFSNRKIGFTIPVINRNNTVGNVLQLKQFENLRNQATSGFFNPFSQGQFVRGPKVLFFWGIGSVPLEYFVSQCDFVHKASLINPLGQPQWTDVTIELILDEESPLFQMEEMFRKVASLTGMTVNAFNTVKSEVINAKPY